MMSRPSWYRMAFWAMLWRVYPNIFQKLWMSFRAKLSEAIQWHAFVHALAGPCQNQVFRASYVWRVSFCSIWLGHLVYQQGWRCLLFRNMVMRRLGQEPKDSTELIMCDIILWADHRVFKKIRTQRNYISTSRLETILSSIKLSVN